MRNLPLSALSLILLLWVSPIYAQHCEGVATQDLSADRDQIPGETMGQKLESLLFWNNEEKLNRFGNMHRLFPSIAIPASAEAKPLTKADVWFQDETQQQAISSYMQDNQLTGLLVWQDGHIRLERYAAPLKADGVWTSFSVAKSITSMLLGVALKQGDIQHLDDKLKTYVPELAGYDYGEVSLRQLASMTSGIAWNEDYQDPGSDVARMYQGECQGGEAHILSYMKRLKKAHEPGEVWNYNTGETDLLGIVLQKATGQSLASYLAEHIWQKYGMQDCAFWLTDECSGLNLGGSGLSASLRDFARLGLVMMQEERESTGLLADAYRQNASKALYQTQPDGSGYGYLWWRTKHSAYAAAGIFGQFLYLNPSKNLVVVQLGAWPKAGTKELVQRRMNFIKQIEAQID